MTTPSATLPSGYIRMPMTGRRVRGIQAASLFHTLMQDFFGEDDGTTYVQTGDIPAMWLRDSSAQTLPYIRFLAGFPALRPRVAGVIERNARNILTDPYANAFQADYHVWERKWEIDSLSFPITLVWTYWKTTGDTTIFTDALHHALRTIVQTYRCEQHHSTCRRYEYPYRVSTIERYQDTGMIWAAFRPSDDPVHYRFNIPQETFAAVTLQCIAAIAREAYGDLQLAGDATQVADEVVRGILRYGVVFAPGHGWMYAYEVDGLGDALLADDANLPNLVGLPLAQWCSPFDPEYLITRDFALSDDDPYYFRGAYAAGIGSEHTPAGFVWPLGILTRALTSTSQAEIAESITTLAETASNEGLIHESFNAGGYWEFTRQEFGWANALWAELVFRSLAGFPGNSLTPEDTVMLPFERPAATPALVPLIVQMENGGEIVAALADLLEAEDQNPNRR
ncbi:MAG: glycoside hydrolase family 125 protein [Candidatus Eremiobacteraeota bacterium]|nr:glycoside hydrolase family 125 protein [Candidatus Eremiobacteraeota bacterium]